MLLEGEGLGSEATVRVHDQHASSIWRRVVEGAGEPVRLCSRAIIRSGIGPQRTARDARTELCLIALNQNLIGAAWNNDVAEARRLIDAGADVNYEDETQQSAFLIAASEGYIELLDLTLRNGADVHARESYNGTALIRAAERGHADVVRRLLETDVDVNHVNNPGWTALHEAIIFGDGSPRYVETVQLLIEGGADVRLPSPSDGLTPLQQATSLGSQDIATVLREATEQ